MDQRKEDKERRSGTEQESKGQTETEKQRCDPQQAETNDSNKFGDKVEVE